MCCKLAKRVALASLQTKEVKASTMEKQCRSVRKLVQLVHIVLSLTKFLSEKGDNKTNFFSNSHALGMFAVFL